MTDAKEDGIKLFSETKSTDAKSPESATFIPEDESKNRMSTINVENVKVVFTGLTKEELMKYANDPFWVRVRWILFALFWVLWSMMLIGAIIIIVVTPKCKEEEPPTWWEKSPLYIIDVAKLSENNLGNNSVIDILKDRINYLKNLGIESLLLKNVLESNKETYDRVTNFTNVNYYLESVDTFRTQVVEYAKDKGVHVILSFVPNHSGKNDYFNKSAKESELKDFYVWSSLKYAQKPEHFPNNWLSVYNGSAWEWDNERKQFYLHQFHKDQPDFNFWNPAVREFFTNILKFWLNMGVENIHLENAEYLFENENFKDNPKGKLPGYYMNEYNFYEHLYTSDLPETQELLRNWSTLVRNHSGLFGVSGGVQNEMSIADLFTLPVKLPSNFNAVVLNNTIASYRTNVKEKPVWGWKCATSGSSNCFTPQIIDGLIVVGFLLPGTPLLEHGQELNASSINIYDNKTFVELYHNASEDKYSRLNLIKKLVELRSLPAFVYGTYSSTVLNNDVFTFTRVKSGTPGHLIAWNLGRNDTSVNFEVLPVIPEDIIVVLSCGDTSNNYSLRRRVSSSNVTIPSMATFVFSFVPKQ